MVRFYVAEDGIHKYVAEFSMPPKTVPFGAIEYEDYTQHHDLKRKKLYLNRHRRREDWTDPKTAGALSRWILWNKPSLEDSLRDYLDRFNMQLEF